MHFSIFKMASVKAQATTCDDSLVTSSVVPAGQTTQGPISHLILHAFLLLSPLAPSLLSSANLHYRTLDQRAVGGRGWTALFTGNHTNTFIHVTNTPSPIS